MGCGTSVVSRPWEVRRAMELSDLIRGTDAKVLASGARPTAEIKRIYAGDRVSDLLSEGDSETLLVTNLAGVQVLRAAGLMDVPAICLLNGIAPEPELKAAAERGDMALLVSPYGMFETCGRLHRCFRGAGETRQ